MGLALGYSPSAQQQNQQQQQSSGPNSSSTPAYIMSPQQLHEPYNTPDGYKTGMHTSDITYKSCLISIKLRSTRLDDDRIAKFEIISIV